MTKIKLIEEYKKLGFKMEDKFKNSSYTVSYNDMLVQSFYTIKDGFKHLKILKEHLEYFKANRIGLSREQLSDLWP